VDLSFIYLSLLLAAGSFALRRLSTNRRLGRLARQHGLIRFKSDRAQYRGEVGGFTVRVGAFERDVDLAALGIVDRAEGNGERLVCFTRFIVERPFEGQPEDRFLIHVAKQLSVHEDVVIGEPAFAAAILDGETCASLSAGDCLDISHEELVLESIELPRLDDAGLRLSWLVTLARRLPGRRLELPPRLLQVALEDRVPQVRIGAARALLSRFIESGEARQLVERGRSDPLFEIRLLSARALGAEGVSLMVELLRAQEASLDLRARVIRDLAAAVERQRLVPILEAALADVPLELKLSLARELVRLGHPPSPCVFGRARSWSDAQAIDVAKLLGELAGHRRGKPACRPDGDPIPSGLEHRGAEPILLELLDRAHPGVREAAADALGRVGTVAAVEKLQRFAQSSWTGAPVRLAAETAIKLIQARVPGGATGALSLAEDAEQAGAVSLAAEGGGLSIEAE
jgi:HEAT repeat protein